MSVFDPVVELVRGLGTTFKMIFEKPVTFQYPEQKREVRPRFRGRHVLKRYDNGLEKCIGCSLCAAACPADAIFVEASENTDDSIVLLAVNLGLIDIKLVHFLHLLAIQPGQDGDVGNGLFLAGRRKILERDIDKTLACDLVKLAVGHTVTQKGAYQCQ